MRSFRPACNGPDRHSWLIRIETAKQYLEIKFGHKEPSSSYQRESVPMPSPQNSENTATKPNVFIMHGHDEVNLAGLKEILQDFDLKPIVMKDIPANGLEHFLSKFERLAEPCSYAFALFSKDDFVKNGGTEIWQGRPNVIFELGWFCHRWSRSKITLLVQEGTTMPSDLLGIEEYRFKSKVKEVHQDIQKTLRQAGLQ